MYVSNYSRLSMMVDTLPQLLSLLGLLPKRDEKNCLANTPPSQVG